MKKFVGVLVATIATAFMSVGLADAVACPANYMPVCGVDGVTHGNTCMANANDIEIAYEGECDEPRACTLEYMPVCGVDGVTYGNECAAGDIDIAYEGECAISHALLEDETSLSTLVDRGHKEGLTIFESALTFMPDQYVTREQAAKMIVHTLQANNIQLPENKMLGCAAEDQDLMDPTLEPFVNKMCQLGLYQGYKNHIMPKNYLTTYEIDIILQRIADKAGNQDVAFEGLPANDISHTPATREELLRTLFVYTVEMPNQNTNPDLTATQEALNQARENRESYELNTYDLIKRASCFCPQDYVRPMKYSIIEGSIDDSTLLYADDQSEVTLENPNLMTISDAFDKIQKAINTNADRITVEYDPFYSYPTTISIDHDYNMADEEEYYEFTLIIDGQGDNQLQGTWKLDMFDGQDVGNYESELLFSANRISIQFCNYLRGTYALDNEDTLTFGPIMSTMMACQDDTLMSMETIFGQIEHPAYTLTNDNHKLTITDGDHTFVFTR